MSIQDMRDFFTKTKHLPTLSGSDEWKAKGKPPLGRLTSQIWETIEVQARYIAELHERLCRLEGKQNV